MLKTYSLPHLNKPKVVLLHGFLGTHEDFLPMVKFLAEDFALELIDLPGHGESSFVSNPAKTISDTLTKPFHLVGYSMGGRIALQIAKQNRFCKSLTLLSAHTGLDSEEEKKMRAKKDLEWCELIKAQGLDRFLDAWYSQPLFLPLKNRKKLYHSVLKKRQNQDPAAVCKVLEAYSVAHDEKTKNFSIPTLAMHGELDLSYATLYSNLPMGVKVIKINKCGHAIPMEKPKECALHLKTFLKELI